MNSYGTQNKYGDRVVRPVGVAREQRDDHDPVASEAVQSRDTGEKHIKMAAFSSSDDEKLIEFVNKNPPLYDSRLHSYKDNVVRDNIWEVISKALNKTSNECKKRWKYIRDSYNRCKRKNKLPTGSSATKTTKWMLFERLRFLDTVPTERLSIATVENTADQNTENTSTAETSGLRWNSEERSEEATSGEVIDTAGRSGLRSAEERSGVECGYVGTSGAEIDTPERKVGKVLRKRKLESNAHSSILEYLQQRDQQRQVEMKTLRARETVSDEDGIDSFCSHIGSVLKKLPPVLRVEAKTKLFNTLVEFELKSHNPSYTFSNNSSSYQAPFPPIPSTSNPTPSPISVASSPAEPTDLSTQSLENLEETNFFLHYYLNVRNSFSALVIIVVPFLLGLIS